MRRRRWRIKSKRRRRKTCSKRRNHSPELGKRALVRDRETHSQRKGDHDEERGGVKEKRTGQDGAVRDESEM